MKKISPSQCDLLQEMGSIGMAHAATGLMNLLGKRVDVCSPQVKCIPLKKVAAILGGADQVVCGVLLEITGEITGSVMMVLPGNSSKELLQVWLGSMQSSAMSFNEYESSALKELGNISIGAYLVALSELTGCTMLCSTPAIATDMLGALLAEGLFSAAKNAEDAVLIETEFKIDKQAIYGYFLLIFEPESMGAIFKKLNVK